MGKSSLILMAVLLVGCTTTKEKIVIQYVDRPVEIPAALRKPCAGAKLPTRWSEQSDATKMLNRQDLALAACNGAKQDVIGLVDDHNSSLTSE